MLVHGEDTGTTVAARMVLRPDTNSAGVNNEEGSDPAGVMVTV